MPSPTPASLDALKAAVADAAPDLAQLDQRIAVALYRLLAAGEPVEVEVIAAATDADAAEVDAGLALWPGVFRDDMGRVVGFWGLALAEMPHRITISNRRLGAWCAWDPMFLSILVGPLDVASDDPVSGERVTYRIEDGDVSQLSHPGAVLAFLSPDAPWDANIMNSFCHYVNNFGDADSAATWVQEHPGTFTISLADGLEIASHYVNQTFGQTR